MAHNQDKTQCWAEANNGLDFAADVAAVLGRASLDEGCLCGDVLDTGCSDPGGKINKWAKFKPIRYPKYGWLTDEERKGTVSDQQNGIFFGIQIVSGQGLETALSTWPRMHDAGYTYLPPNGGANAPYRILDFSSDTVQTGESHAYGYKSNAAPNPSGQFNSSIGFWNGHLDNITAQYSTSNVMGVDLSEILRDPPRTMQDVLEKTYPCVLVTDESGNTPKSYITALSSTTGNVPRPLLYNNVYLNEWYIEFDSTTHHKYIHGRGTLQPFRANNSQLKMTLFMLCLPGSQYLDSNGYPCLSAGGPNLHDYWFDCNLDGDLVGPSRPVPFPNGIYQSLKLKEWFSPPVRVKPSTATFTMTGGNITDVTITFEKEEADVSSVTEYTYQVSADYNNNNASKSAITKQIQQFPTSVQFNASEFGGAQYFVSGQTLRVTVVTTVTGSSGSNTQIKNFTIQV